MTAPDNTPSRPRAGADDRPRVLVAGGGVAGLEACLALRVHAMAEDVEIVLLAPEDHFEYRPLTVLEPFAPGGARWRLELAAFAEDQDLRHERAALASVDVPARRVRTVGDARIDYDLLLIAVGAQTRRPIPGVLTFRGAPDLAAFRRVLGALETGADRRVAFAVPGGTFWALPLYELALLTAGHLARAGVDGVEIVLVTPEPAPLSLFGTRASAAVTGLLEKAGIAVRTGAHPIGAAGGALRLRGGESVAADAIVTLPRLYGRPIPGLPRDEDAFVRVDDLCRVHGCPGVFAAGDITTFPLKQGGVAAQQADTAAQAILAELGFPIAPAPFSPVVQGVLLTGGAPAFLRAGRHPGDPGLDPRSYSLWWPPSKIASRHLAPYLTIHAGAPLVPEAFPEPGAIPVEVDLAHAVHAVQPPSWSDRPDAVQPN